MNDQETRDALRMAMADWDAASPQARARAIESAARATELYSEDELEAFAAQYTVKRPDLFGNVHDTHQTESELNGWRETQGRML